MEPDRRTPPAQFGAYLKADYDKWGNGGARFWGDRPVERRPWRPEFLGLGAIIQGIAHPRVPASQENPMNTRDAALAKLRELTHFIAVSSGPRRKRRPLRRCIQSDDRRALAAKVPLASKAEVERAIAVAKEAFAGWSETSPLTRGLGSCSASRS